MSLLIDGYNLLHVTSLVGRGSLAGTLQGAREALLTFLADSMPAKERRRAMIVFDAAGAPPGLPDRVSWESISVVYARGYADADALLEEILENRRDVKGLTVVSSDHRVQRAARRRGAGYTDSDRWFLELRRRAKSVESSKEQPGKEAVGGSIAPADYWVEQFSDEATLQALERAEETLRQRTPRPKDLSPRPAPGQSPGRGSPKRRQKHRQKRDIPQAFGEGIFPPGYVEDLAKRFEEGD